MYVGLFDLFKIGIGPSSSHTMGPMLAANQFLVVIDPAEVAAVSVDLYGSLSATDKGHKTDEAIICGLSGLTAETITTQDISETLSGVKQGQLRLGGKYLIPFSLQSDIRFTNETRDEHPNALEFFAYNETGETIRSELYFSIGGGFVQTKGELLAAPLPGVKEPFPFRSFKNLLGLCLNEGLSISRVMLENEKTFHSEDEIKNQCVKLYDAMRNCVETGFHAQGLLPGGLKVRRRAPSLYKSLVSGQRRNLISIGFEGMDWVNLYALAINEENAAGGRMVTAPTNGAAGIVPAVLLWFMDRQVEKSPDVIRDFFLVAAAIGSLCKRNASISGAEVGCQGEVGSACAMAAGALCEVLGGTPEQVENAAEIGLEHNLGLTCDPIGGLVQVPCIERNAIAAVKAINAAHLALMGDGRHFVSFDKVLQTMKETGKDMQDKYKETSRGGLAVSTVEC